MSWVRLSDNGAAVPVQKSFEGASVSIARSSNSNIFPETQIFYLVFDSHVVEVSRSLLLIRFDTPETHRYNIRVKTQAIEKHPWIKNP